MNIHVIIATYNGMRWVEQCIGSVLNSSISVKVCVVDNASSDETVAFIKSRYPEVDLTVNEESIGFGKANNILIRKALADNADYVLLMNQDAWVDKNTIEGMVKISQQHAEYGIVSPIHLNGSGNAFDYKFAVYCNETRCVGFLSDVYLNTTKDIYDIHFVNAAFWLISKECLKNVGLFDPLFGMYGEDKDYVNRVRNKGFKIGITPAYRGYHDRHQRPYSKQHERHIRKIKSICILKDINKNFAWEFSKYVVSSSGIMVKHLLRRRFGDFVYEIQSSFSIYKSIPRYLKCRQNCQQTGAYINV